MAGSNNTTDWALEMKERMGLDPLEMKLRELKAARDLEGMKVLGKSVEVAGEFVRTVRTWVDHCGKITQLARDKEVIAEEIRKIEAQTQQEAKREKKSEVIESFGKEVREMVMEMIPALLSRFPDLPQEERAKLVMELLQKLPQVKL